MSTATFGQAAHSLVILGQQELSADHLRVLHDGYLADLAQAVRDGTIPPRDDFRRFVGLTPTFPVWKSVQIGGKSKDELLAEMQLNGFSVSDQAKDVMSKSAVSISEPQTLDFARVKVRDLGFKKEPMTREVWECIRALGHNLCPPDAGPHIRLAYPEQDHGDWFLVALGQITDSDGEPRVFLIGTGGDDQRRLHTYRVGFGDRWLLDMEVVFVLCK